MGLQYLVCKRAMKCGYEKLTSDGSEKMRRVGRSGCWLKSVNGRLRGLRLSRSKKIYLGGFSTVLLSSRIVRIYTHVVNRINMENMYPAVVVPTQWGLPMVSHSHPSVVCRRSTVIPSNRNRKFTF